MDKERERILREILEHTIDCDYNRSIQFKAHKKYSRKYRICQTIQNISLLFLIGYYILFYSIPQIMFHYKWMGVVPVICSIVAVFFELWCLFGDYLGLANRCWISGQAYTKLYRDCQFFHNHYDLNDIEILRLKAKDIAEQLNGYNLFSPHIDEKIFKETEVELHNKIYPLKEIINNKCCNNNSVVNDELLNCLKSQFDKFLIEIIHFGSSLKSYSYNDIDLAIIIYSDNVSKEEIYEKIINLEQKYLFKESVLDISFFLKRDFDDITLYPYVKCIKEGDLLYRSDEIKESIIKNIKFDLLKYKTSIEELFKSLDSDLRNNRFDILKLYYFFYCFMSYILIKNGKTWNSEETFRREFIKLSEKNNEEIFKEFKHDIYMCYEILRKLRVYKLEYAMENWIPDKKIEQTIYKLKKLFL